jgi:hypothetical protein
VALGTVSVAVTWRRDDDFSLLSTEWHSAKSLSSARQKVAKKPLPMYSLPRLVCRVFSRLCRVLQTLSKEAISGSAHMGHLP